jgi:hypothetical protein
VRRYGKWAGNPAGMRENLARCVVNVRPFYRSHESRQCTRYRKVGELCAQHAKQKAAGVTLSIPNDEEEVCNEDAG